ncbi:MAG: hypothetical protein C0501_17470 [Isosphaera sp.]|nr:hypothetical protein [Isosphaera sp.]
MTTSGLTPRQRFELAYLGEQYESRGDCGIDPVYGPMVWRFAELIRYIRAEGIRPDQFGRRDEMALNPAWTVAWLLADPLPPPPGSIMHAALVLADHTPDREIGGCA